MKSKDDFGHIWIAVVCFILGMIVTKFILVPYFNKKEDNIEIKLPRVEIRSTK